MAHVKIGNENVVVSEFSARKAIRVMKILREISKAWPGLSRSMAEFHRAYREEHWDELDRATARFRYGPKPIVDESREPVLDENGKVQYSEDLLAHISDEDWEKSGQKLRLPRSPSPTEEAVAIFPEAFDKAEELMLQLAALVVIPNADLGRAARDGGADAVTDLLKRRSEELLDEALGDQLLELLVAASEVVEQQFASKVRELGERVGNLRRLLGLGSQTPTEATDGTPSSSTTNASSSTDSPSPTDGAKSEPSTAPAGDSSKPLTLA